MKKELCKDVVLRCVCAFLLAKERDKDMIRKGRRLGVVGEKSTEYRMCVTKTLTCREDHRKSVKRERDRERVLVEKERKC